MSAMHLFMLGMAVVVVGLPVGYLWIGMWRRKLWAAICYAGLTVLYLGYGALEGGGYGLAGAAIGLAVSTAAGALAMLFMAKLHRRRGTAANAGPSPK